MQNSSKRAIGTRGFVEFGSVPVRKVADTSDGGPNREWLWVSNAKQLTKERTFLQNRFFDFLFNGFFGMNGFLFEFGRRKNQPGRFLWLCAIDENRTSIRIENQLSLSPNHQQQNHNHSTQSKIHNFVFLLFWLFRLALRRRQSQIGPRQNVFLEWILRNPLHITLLYSIVSYSWENLLALLDHSDLSECRCVQPAIHCIVRNLA